MLMLCRQKEYLMSNESDNELEIGEYTRRDNRIMPFHFNDDTLLRT